MVSGQVFRLVPLGNAAGHNALAFTVVQGQLQQLLGALDRLTGQHFRHSQLYLGEVLNADHGNAFGGVLLFGFFRLLGLGLFLLLLFLHGVGNQLVQLFDFLVHVDAGEQGLALVNLHALGQYAPFAGALIGNGLAGNAQLLLNAGRGLGHEGRQQDGDNTQALAQVVHDSCQTGLLGLVLAQCPGHGLVDIFVAAGNQLPDFCQCVGELIFVDGRVTAVPQGGSHFDQLVVQRVGFSFGRNHAAEVLLHHGSGTGQQVAQIVGKVGVNAGNQSLVGEQAVAAEGDFPEQEVADGVHAVALAEDIGVHHVALGLAHLGAVAEQEPAVAVYLLGQRQIQRHEDGGPDDGVEPDDLLAHKVDVSRPVLVVIGQVVAAVAQSSDIVGQCVHPHIHHMLGVKVHRHAPGKAGAGNTQVAQALLDEVNHLVFAALRLDELGVLFIQLQNAVAVFGKTEEIGLFLSPFDLTAAVGAFAVLQLGLGPESLTVGAVPALILALIDLPAVVQLFENLLHALDVIVVGGADKTVIADIQKFPQILENGNDMIHILFGGDALRFGLLLDFQAVLIGAGEEHDVAPLHSLITGDGVAGNGAIAVPDVGVAGRIIDGCGDVKRLFVHGCSLQVDLQGRPSHRPKPGYTFLL